MLVQIIQLKVQRSRRLGKGKIQEIDTWRGEHMNEWYNKPIVMASGTNSKCRG